MNVPPPSVSAKDTAINHPANPKGLRAQLTAIAVVFFTSAAVVTAVKQALVPQLGLWTQHIMTIAVSSVAAAVAAWFAHSQQSHLLVQAEQEAERRRESEAVMKVALESAEAANVAKSAFLATMSHEIRTPMNGILGMTELVLDSELTAEQRQNLELVRMSAESLLAVINDILDFSKVEAGKMEIESIPFDLRDALGETIKMSGFLAHQKGLELVCDVAPDVPEALVGDPGRIRQVVFNLVGNAVKFTDQGEILVSVSCELEPEGSASLHFAVKDTGLGIPEDKQKVVFDAFSQADSSTQRRYGGTGLGLAICRRLVEQMGGRIWVQSQLGAGSTFHFTVRLPVGTAGTISPALIDMGRLQDLPVLIVDDNFTSRHALQTWLRRWGVRAEACGEGRRALEALEAARKAGRPFRLTLLDGHMPGMDGFSLAGHLHANPGLSGATVMMLTSAGHPGEPARCRELGVSACLVKPIRQCELLEVLRNVVRGGEAPLLKPAAPRNAETPPRSRVGRRVLLAEDNPVNQTLAVHLLKKEGHDVTVAGDGRSALAAWESGHFDVILMDIQMPGMDGMEATAAIRRREVVTGEHIRIVAMTAHALKGDRERCLCAGMDAYVAKPIRRAELMAAMEPAVCECIGPEYVSQVSG